MSKISASSLTQAQETLLIPLWARALESKRADAIIRDPKAAQIVERIDYDFDRFHRMGVDPVGFCSRAVIFDSLVREFLDRFPDGTVVEIGAGLDSRFERVDNGRVRWFDLDLPEAMSIRRQFYEENERRKFLTTSVLDTQWFATIRPHVEHGLLLLAEGVFYFFEEQQLRNLFSQLCEAFPGGVLAFDCQSPLYLWYSRLRHPIKTAELRWSLGNVHKLERWHPRLKVERWIGFGDSPYYDAHLHRFPWTFRTARKLCPPLRSMFKIVIVKFEQPVE